MSRAKDSQKTATNDADKTTSQASSSTREGKVISMNDYKLRMTNDGKESSYTLTKEAKLTCDGAVCKARDLKPGSKIRVTTKKDDGKVVTVVEALDKNSKFS